MITHMSTKQALIYHQCLRSSALLLIALLIFDSGFISPLTKQLSNNTYNYVANVISVGAAVAPTELNILTAELTAQKKALEDREKNLKEREMAVGLGGETQSSKDISTYVLSVLLFIILVLLTLNYALDFSRERRLFNASLKPKYE
jgi:hypothetical protein